MTELSHVHVFEPGSDPRRPVILLLHGTGGDETQLLEFGRQAAPGSALLSVRGQVLEDGKLRYFGRHVDGTLDEDDVRRRAGHLAIFIGEAREAYGLATPVVIGRSNGANIAAALLQLHPDSLAGAVLLRAIAPLSDAPSPDLTGKPVLIITGEHDTIAPLDWSKVLATQLSTAGASVQHVILPCAHEQTPRDLEEVKRWLGSEYP